MAKRAGKKLEGELGPALKNLGAWDYNSNDPSPACDRIVHWHGIPILIEAKETRDGKVAFARFSERERRYLDWHLPHGLTLVVVQWVTARPQLWVARWEHVLDMERISKVRHLPFPPFDPRWVEVARTDRPHSLGRCWDLEPVLKGMLG